MSVTDKITAVDDQARTLVFGHLDVVHNLCTMLASHQRAHFQIGIETGTNAQVFNTWRQNIDQSIGDIVAVAAADDRISTEESSEIHQIGEELGFTRPEVNGLRLEWRDKISELDPTPAEA